MKRIARYLIVFLCLVNSLRGQQQSPLPELPPDIPKDAIIRIVLSDMTPSGQDAVWHSPDGAIHEFFQFNDRGRGPKIYSTYRVDADGLLISQQSQGVDYMKSLVQEHFSIVDGTAYWKNQAEEEKRAGASGKYYVDLDGGPEGFSLLVRALLNPKHNSKLSILPGGVATIRKLQSVTVEVAGNKLTTTLYELNGLAFTPSYIWLDEQKQFFATVSGWSTTILRGFESAVPTLLESQQKVESSRASELARKLTVKPSGDVVIRDVTVFDSLTGQLLPHQRVTIQGPRITAVKPDQGQTILAGSQVIDGSGKILLPGLWDMHEHIGADTAFLDIATGVTTVRDLGNSIEELAKLRKQIDAGTQIGPRIVLAGFIDGPGPYEGPIKVLAATPEEARQRVDRYADLGYVQIKIYSSVKPELVPVIIEEAHKRGMRVSGHVPANMIAEQFIREGADEIQHMNFIFLNFMPDVKETRTPARFTEPGKRGADLDLHSQQVTDFIALLKQHHTVIDPTMGAWESTYLSRPGEIPQIDAPMFARLPVQVQRGIKAGGDALPASDPQTDKQYRGSYANMVRMLKLLYDNGVQIVAGTDAASGYAFDRELEIYVGAGIPATEVLRMATIEAATLMHRDRELGSITAGKFADVILVNGDPTKRISDIRNIDLVIKNGELYTPSEMYPSFGIRAQ